MTKFNRDLRGLAYDEGDDGADTSALMKDDGSPIVDSAKAHRILCGCVGGLSAEDMMTVAEMMASNNMIAKSELDALTAALASSRDGGKEEKGVAMDAAIMSRRRAQVVAGLRPASDLHLPISRAQSAADVKRFSEKFPETKRLSEAR